MSTHGAQDSLSLTLWTWAKDATIGVKSTTTSSALLSTPYTPKSGELQIICSPLDILEPQALTALENYLHYHHVPPEFLIERQQGVNHSFGSMPSRFSTETQVSWFHILCKNVVTDTDAKDKRPLRVDTDEKSWSKVKRVGRWLHFSFVLVQTDTPEPSLTLLCFHPTTRMLRLFDNLLQSSSWVEVMDEPYLLFTMIFDVIWLTMDTVAWDLANVFRYIEGDTLDVASEADTAAARVDFAYLHNISKHAIYLNEAFEAAQHLVSSIRDEHSLRTRGTATISRNQIYTKFERHIRLFRQTQLRLMSLKERVTNITNLSFNVVTQQDSRIMQRDSASMHTIAIMTMIFLPGTLIATLFSSAFFSFGIADNGSARAYLSPFFWIFWVIAIPCTAVVLGLWIKLNPAKVRKFALRRKNL